MATKKPNPEKLIPIEAAALRRGLSSRTLRRYVADGRLKAYRVGVRLVFVDQDDVDALARPVPAGRAS